jgi:AcrR family transcriptional regulator
VRRPRQLRNAIARYLVKHGLFDLSLRPLAKAVGSSPRGLLYHFGSKEKMIIAVVAELRRQQRVAYEVQAKTFSEACQVIWKRMSAPDSEPFFRLFFEVYGIALRQPHLYKDFLHDTVEDWLRAIAGPLSQQGHKESDARAFATVVIAGLRGFMLDYCATHDRRRVEHALRLWLSRLDSMMPAGKGIQ